GIEFFMAWYSGNEVERFVFLRRALGPYAWAYWIMVTCNVIVPQFLWFYRIRRSVIALLVISLLVNIGMWFERFVIVVSTLSADFIPAMWGYYKHTWVDILTFAGSFGLFLTLFLLFIRFLPMIAISELKAILPKPNTFPEK
ncbi:MAG: hydrogenase, partial [bacterium]